ncbi:MAG: hypothetical protein DMG69_31410 [Acidobacteria bacterium]|nr:MAG: hypothetical protein DMG69_31410 [Acidobacteriota bacterium]
MAATVSGNRLNVYGAMTCSGKTVAGRLQPATPAIAAGLGMPITLQALNISCSQPNGSVQVTVSPGGQAITLLDNGSGPDQASGDGIYSGQWTPAAIGEYTLTFPGNDAVNVSVLTNYAAATTSYNYRTITGTSLNLSDDSVAQITSPFPVQFGGGKFSTLQVGSNGTVSFTDAYSPYIYQLLPMSNSVPTTVVAPFWADLYPVTGSAQNVYWAVTGTAPNRELVIEWRDVRSFVCRNDVTATVRFEVVFSESSDNVLFEYADTTFGGQCYWQDFGGDAEVGVQVAPSTGTTWTVNREVVASGTALLWTLSSAAPAPNPVPVLNSISPSSATIGGPAFTLTANGANFVPTSVIQFNITDRPTTFVSSTQLTAQISAQDIVLQVASSVYVDVLTPGPGGGESQLLTFSFASNVPTITSISPTSAPAGSFPFQMTITGTGFAQTSGVYWNGNVAGSTVVSSTQILVAIGGNLLTTQGTAQITVVNGPPGGGTSNAVPFTILPPGPTVYLQQPAPFNFHSGPQGQNSSSPPVRFLGWNYAHQAGPQYLNQFLRTRADVPPNGGSVLQSTTEAYVQPAASVKLPGLQLRPSLPADFIPTAVATGDFDGDGIPDWVVANGGSSNLWVYLGKGDGTFKLAIVIPLVGQSPVAVAAADLRGTGKLDLVVAEADSLSIGVLLGNGDGTFLPEATYYVTAPPISLAVADFNGDGKPDVVAGVLANSVSGPLVMLPGIGNGGFGLPVLEPRNYNDVQYPEWLVAGDFETNGKPDIALVDPNWGALVYGNAGTGQFKRGLPLFYGFVILPITVAQGDVNEDGCQDVIVVDDFGLARVFLGNCDGSFQSQSSLAGLGETGWGVALADVNGDGHLDLITSGIYIGSLGNGQAAGDLISVLMGDGKGNFSNPHVYRAGQTAYGIAVADLNRDGYPDIITANEETDDVSILLNDGKGGFGSPEGEYIGYMNGNSATGPVNSPYTSFLASDVDGDGKTDLVLMSVGPGYALAFQATVMLNGGSGQFGVPIRTPAADGIGNFYDFALGDFRHTGRPDLLTLAGYLNDELAFEPNIGAGQFGSPERSPLGLGSGPAVIAVGDFNRDGNLDFVIAGAPFSISTPAITVTVYLGKGDGTFTAQPPINVPNNSPGHWVQGFWAGDFNGDGNLDLHLWLYVNTVPD